jgi:nucleotide-binding universal stress UspA family protein
MAALTKMPERPQMDHLSIHKILVPIVFADTSRHVIQQAAWLARRLQAEIILLHVVTPFNYPAGIVEAGDEITARDLTSRVVSQAQRDLDQTLPPEFDGVAVTRVLLRGDPAREIAKAAVDRNVDLILMSTHGHAALYRFLLGSVTAKVLHETDCPVWTGAHLEDAAAGEFAVRNVLCSVDLSHHSYRTAALADQLATSIGAALTLVHITESVGIYGPGGLRIDPTWKKTIVGLATKEMDKLQQSVGTKAGVIIDSGNVLQLTGEAAARTKADLLVIGHSPVRGHLGDNGNGYAIIRESRIPVLSV